MTDNDIKKILDSVLEQYINFDTRKNFEEKVQRNTVLVNKGVTRACEIIISDFGQDKDELAIYAKKKLAEVINSGVQKAHVHDPEDLNV